MNLTELSPQEIKDLRDKYRWRAEMELALHGATPRFYALSRSYRVLDCEVDE